MEWFRALVAKYPQHQMIIFDPYFESAGLGLLLLNAAPKADYIVFRSLPKKASKKSEAAAQESGKPNPSGIDNLMANCEQNRHLLNRIKLRIYGLKEGRLHDRYILIMGADKLPVAGFNLSNSLQAAAQEQPLLITPIPADVLIKVDQYQSELIREAQASQTEGETANPSMRLLFDSTTSPTVQPRYESLDFLEKDKAGDVLSVWTGEPSLKGLSGDPLREQIAALELIKDESPALSETAGLRNFLDLQAGDFIGFTATWEILGELLARSRTENHPFLEIESKHGFLEFLARFLETSFNRTHDEVGKELAVTDARFFREPIETLLHSSYHPHHFSHATKFVALTWSEYYTIKILWWHAPEALLTISEAQMASLPTGPQGPDVMRLSLLSQIVSEISVSVRFNIGEAQRDRLLRSGNGLMQWMGLHVIEQQLGKPGGLALALQVVATFPYSEQVRTLGWMVHRAAGNPKKAEIYEGLITALHAALPTTIPVDDLKHLVDSVRGHMRQLAWAEPWLSHDVVFPLLQNDRANIDDASEIWIEELASLLGTELQHQPRLFDRTREGQVTNIAAFLFAHSSSHRQRASCKSMQELLNRQRRIVQQPLASTSDWKRWDDALVVSMWILTFTRWSQYYLRGRGTTDSGLEVLSRVAHELAMVRPMGEWRSIGAGKRGELAAFLDQVDELLTSIDESENSL